MTFTPLFDGETMTADDREAPARFEARIALLSSNPDLVAQVMSALRKGPFGGTLVPGNPSDPDTAIPPFCEVIVLDLDGHGRPAAEVVASVRDRATVPILSLSTRDDEASKVEALNAGAADYITVPFGPSEFLARVQAARRVRTNAPDVPFSAYADPISRTITLDGRAIPLTRTEWRLLQILARSPGEVVPHARLLTEVWGPLAESRVHYLRVYMNRLRRKIEVDINRPTRILSVPRLGYVFRSPKNP